MKTRTAVSSQQSAISSYKNRGLETSHSSLVTNRGMALVLTLMVVTIITALVVEFAYGVYTNTSALYNWQTSQKLSLAAQSAARLGSKLINEDLPEFRTSDHFIISQKIPFQDLDGTIILRIEDENAKFNLNSLTHSNDTENDTYPIPAFKRLLEALELNSAIADKIVDWMDRNKEPRPGLRDSENDAKNAKLDSVDEILLIPGIDREIYEKLLPYVTIFGDAKININRASVPALRSLSESITKEDAEQVVRYRALNAFKETDDIQHVSARLGSIYMGFRNNMTTTGTAYRIVAAAESDGIRRIIESVLEGSEYSKTVKYWKEM